MKKIFITGFLGIAAVIFGFQFAQSDDEHDDENGKFSTITRHTRDVAPVSNPLYVEECASCHMAYPPGLLPSRSWQKLMTSLENHFGENAEVDPGTNKALTHYLMENSADKSEYRRSRKIIRSLAQNQLPLRITGLPYIQKEHREIPDKLIQKNPKVGSLSNCIACHRQAEQGSFSEREISIPDYGRWDD